MLFAFLLATAVCQSFGMRPEESHSKVASIARLGQEVANARQVNSSQKRLEYLQTAAGMVNSIMLQAGNATEHMSDDDVALLNSVISLIDKSIYGSMDSSHQSDQAAIQAAAMAIEQCNTNIAARLEPMGDLDTLYWGVVFFQNSLNDAQEEVDEKAEVNRTKLAELQRHVDNIGDAPECASFPKDPTKLKVDNYFETSPYVNWYTAQQEAYAPVAAAYEAADSDLTAAIMAYAVAFGRRFVAYCDWKVELKEGCQSFEACYTSKKTLYENELTPALQRDMQVRIDAYKAGATIIAQIHFLLGESTESTPPSDIDTSRFRLNFPDAPAMGECSLDPLSSDRWVPKPLCSTHTVPRFVKYPGSSTKLNVVGHMTIATNGRGDQAAQTLRWSMSGLDTACVEGWLEIARPANSCGVHIHTGTSCDTAAGVGGHFWDNDQLESDPWKTTVYSAEGGSSVQTSVSELAVTGLSSDAILGRVMVVHDSTGARIACGVIE